MLRRPNTNSYQILDAENTKEEKRQIYYPGGVRLFARAVQDVKENAVTVPSGKLGLTKVP
jgi:hypothetical protein